MEENRINNDSNENLTNGVDINQPSKNSDLGSSAAENGPEKDIVRNSLTSLKGDLHRAEIRYAVIIGFAVSLYFGREQRGSDVTIPEVLCKLKKKYNQDFTKEEVESALDAFIVCAGGGKSSGLPNSPTYCFFTPKNRGKIGAKQIPLEFHFDLHRLSES